MIINHTIFRVVQALLLLILRIFDARHVEPSTVWKHVPSWGAAAGSTSAAQLQLQLGRST